MYYHGQERRPPDMTMKKELAPASGDQECIECGYEPELKRTLGSFQVFAISFAFISVAVGIFGTYDNVLQTAGPVGIWLWLVAAVGQTMVAFVVAQFAARIAVVALDNALASQALMPLLGMDENEGTARVITLVILVLQAVLVIASTRLL